MFHGDRSYKKGLKRGGNRLFQENGPAASRCFTGTGHLSPSIPQEKGEYLTYASMYYTCLRMQFEISSTEAVRRFGDCLARIKYRGDHFVITRNDEPVAELVPALAARRATWAELEEAVKGLPFDPTFADDLAEVNEADQIPANPWD